MKKRVMLAFLFFVVGMASPFFTYGFFRKTIQDVYVWGTSGKVQFFGKEFYLFFSPYYYIALAFLFTVFILRNFQRKTSSIIKQFSLAVILFFSTVFIISYVLANLALIECTACEDGIKPLHYNAIPYSSILKLAALVAAIPSLLLLFKEGRLLKFWKASRARNKP
ncbi:MAG: hypothetical protein WBG71_04055 [Leeuwenhoekiella sp.]